MAGAPDLEEGIAGFHLRPAPLSVWNPVDRQRGSFLPHPIDAISWIIRLERRSAKHEELLRTVAARAQGHLLERSLSIDLVVDRNIIVEIKSLEEDPVAQTRAALAQLYHYRFAYREELPQSRLLAVFGGRPADGRTDLVDFLESCGIGVARPHGSKFDGNQVARITAPWLF